MRGEDFRTAARGAIETGVFLSSVVEDFYVTTHSTSEGTVTHRETLQRVRLRNVPIVPFTQEQLMAKVAYWGGRCWLCGEPWTDIDHVKPIAAGGGHMLANLRPICPVVQRLERKLLASLRGVC